MTLVYASGAQFTFVETDPGVWASVGALTDKLVGDGENLILRQTHWGFGRWGYASTLTWA